MWGRSDEETDDPTLRRNLRGATSLGAAGCVGRIVISITARSFEKLTTKLD